MIERIASRVAYRYLQAETPADAMKRQRATVGVLWMHLDSAHETLNEFVGDWVFRASGSAKQALMRAYLALEPKEKKALAMEVQKLVGGPVTVYRTFGSGAYTPGDPMGGSSVTDDPKALRGPNTYAFRVTPDEVMLHYGQPDSWLGSKRYAHEHEMILKPDASPTYLGHYNPDTGQIESLG